MSLFEKRDRAEFERVAMEQEKRVYAICLHMMGNREDALDCAQETMLRAYRGFAKFRGQAAASTWMTRIAMNACIDALRKRRDVISLDALREEAGFDPPAQQPSVYAQLEARERQRLLHEALQKLPAEARQVIILRDMQGLSYQEVGETLSLSEGTVKSRLNRARKKLFELLRESAELFSSESVQYNREEAEK